MRKNSRNHFRAKDYRNFLRRKKAQPKIVAVGDTTIVHEATKEIIVYQSELDYLSCCILDCPNIETGGQLFGFYASKGTPVVCYAIGAGEHANHQITFFNQDIDYLQTIGTILNQEYGLQHIGEWHSHHRLGLDHPSGHDAQTMHNSIDALHLGQFLLCIGTTDGRSANINAYTFRENDPYYYPSKWHIKAEPSPYRQVIDERLKDLLVHPITPEPRLSGMHISRVSVSKYADMNYLLRAYNTNSIDL